MAAALKFPTNALIDGKWVSGAKSFAVTDPATGEDACPCA